MEGEGKEEVEICISFSSKVIRGNEDRRERRRREGIEQCRHLREVSFRD